MGSPEVIGVGGRAGEGTGISLLPQARVGGLPRHPLILTQINHLILEHHLDIYFPWTIN